MQLQEEHFLHTLPIMDLKKMLYHIEETSSLIQGHSTLLPLSLYTCFDCQQTMHSAH